MISTIKNNSITIFSILTFVLIAQMNATSQVSGFLGKRLIIGFEVPATLKVGIWNDYEYTYGTYESDGNFVSREAYGSVSLKYRPTVKLEYVVSRKSSLQFFTRFFTPKVDAAGFRETQAKEGFNRFSFTPKEKVKMRTINIGLSYKWYAGDAICPIGVYQTVGVEYSMMKFLYETDSFSAFNSEVFPNEIMYKNPSPEKAQVAIITYGVGKQYALGPTLLMNIGAEFGLPLKIYGVETNYSELLWAEHTGAREARYHALLNLVLGFSFAL